MNLDDPRIEKISDPNAPKALDLAKCQRWIASAANFRRQPLGGFIADDLLPQLKCACDELGTISTKIADANNQALRYQKEAETANAEVRVMQRQLGDERGKVETLNAERSTLNAEVERLKARVSELEKPAEVGVAPKRGRKAKVVPIDEAQPRVGT